MNHYELMSKNAKEQMLKYSACLKTLENQIDVLRKDLELQKDYAPIEHVKSRIKTLDSAVQKLENKGIPVSLENLVNNVHDMVGIRIVCAFISDVYEVVDLLKSCKLLNVIQEQDYIKNPKESGYKSYHMLVSVPIFLSDSVVDTKVEIQIRTIAMDFWASLEHKIYYKFEGDAPDYISRDLRECAEMVSTLDEKMLSLNEAIQECLEKQEELNMSTKTKESNRQDQRVLQGLD